MKLFNEINRDYEGPAHYVEPVFTYLNRSARLAVGRIRQLLETWSSHYPAVEKAELRRKFSVDQRLTASLGLL